MELIKTYLRAFGQSYTYNPGRNLYLWFGVLWGLPIPFFSLYLDWGLGGSTGRSLAGVLANHPIHLFFLVHPLLFGIVFGGMGTVRRNLEEDNEKLIETLTELATTDPLTGLYNRRFVLEELKNMLLRSHRTGAPAGVVLFDLDNFKEVNDRQGHFAGDRVLRDVGASLKSVLREGEVLGRYGGDEFLLVLQGDATAARRLADRALNAIWDGVRQRATAGVASRPEDGDTPEALIAAADRDLGEAKARVHAVRGETSP